MKQLGWHGDHCHVAKTTRWRSFCMAFSGTSGTSGICSVVTRSSQPSHVSQRLFRQQKKFNTIITCYKKKNHNNNNNNNNSFCFALCYYYWLLFSLSSFNRLLPALRRSSTKTNPHNLSFKCWESRQLGSWLRKLMKSASSDLKGRHAMPNRKVNFLLKYVHTEMRI